VVTAGGFACRRNVLGAAEKRKLHRTYGLIRVTDVIFDSFQNISLYILAI
jgi:hypothetical protein